MKQKILLASNLATKKIWRDALAKHTDDVRRDRSVYYHNRYNVYHLAH